LNIHTGGEIRLDWFGGLSDEELVGASLGGTGRWILLELPYEGWPLELASILDGLAVRGIGAVLAHPERCAAVQRAPDRLWDPVGRGALLQINAGSLTGEHGSAPERTAKKLIAGGLCHLLASDSHSADRRPPGMGPGLAEAAMILRRDPEDLTDLVEETPAKILAGEKVSPSPRTPPQEPPAPVRPGPDGGP
jgi:protein-tyrosine phosphatase